MITKVNSITLLFIDTLQCVAQDTTMAVQMASPVWILQLTGTFFIFSIAYSNGTKLVLLVGTKLATQNIVIQVIKTFTK